jgi:hypothetical protein
MPLPGREEGRAVALIRHCEERSDEAIQIGDRAEHITFGRKSAPLSSEERGEPLDSTEAAEIDPHRDTHGRDGGYQREDHGECPPYVLPARRTLQHLHEVASDRMVAHPDDRQAATADRPGSQAEGAEGNNPGTTRPNRVRFGVCWRSRVAIRAGLAPAGTSGPGAGNGEGRGWRIGHRDKAVRAIDETRCERAATAGWKQDAFRAEVHAKSARPREPSESFAQIRRLFSLLGFATSARRPGSSPAAAAGRGPLPGSAA